MDWKQRKYNKSTKVKLKLVNTEEVMEGILLTDYDLDSNDNEMPEIKLDSGEVILGCNCWWIPLNEIKNQ